MGPLHRSEGRRRDQGELLGCAEDSVDARSGGVHRRELDGASGYRPNEFTFTSVSTTSFGASTTKSTCRREFTVAAAESTRGTILGYDPYTYVETSFFGEDDTRSNLVRLVSDTLTKIINVPNTKEHQASGVRYTQKISHTAIFPTWHAPTRWKEKTYTLSFIGTLAAVEPLPSRVVLHVMDGLRAVWQAGPFSEYPQFRFYPKQIWVGTDPVAMDLKLIELIESEAQGGRGYLDLRSVARHLGDNHESQHESLHSRAGARGVRRQVGVAFLTRTKSA